MEDSYTITQASTDQHILDILALQRKNVKQVLTTGDIEVEGFVTCEHDFALLKKMNQPDGHIIALSDEIVVGYCLVMSPLWRDEVEVIRSMFDTIEKSSWNGQAILPEDYVVMGQGREEGLRDAGRRQHDRREHRAVRLRFSVKGLSPGCREVAGVFRCSRSAVGRNNMACVTLSPIKLACLLDVAICRHKVVCLLCR